MWLICCFQNSKRERVAVSLILRTVLTVRLFYRTTRWLWRFFGEIRECSAVLLLFSAEQMVNLNQILCWDSGIFSLT